MFNKLFWKNKENSKNTKKSKSILGWLSQKVKQSRLAFGLLVGGILSWCASQQDVQSFDTQKIDQDNWYAQATQKKAGISEIASALSQTGQNIEIRETQNNKNIEIVVKTQEKNIQNNDEDSQEEKVETQKYNSFHVVKPWERIYSIARKWGLNPYKVMKLNESRFEDLNKLQVGDKILLGDILQGENISTEIIAEQKTKDIQPEKTQKNIDTVQWEDKTVEKIGKINIQDINIFENPEISTATQVTKADAFDITSLIENTEIIWDKTPKTYEVREWDSLDIIARRENINLGKLIEFNSFLAIRNKKPIIYPGHKIFIEPADIHSQEVQDIIEIYNNYHAAIDYDRRMRAEYKAEIIARRHPGFQQNKEEKNIQETKKETQKTLDLKSHKIVYGETLSHVAVKFSTTVYDLQKENNIADPSKISIGQIIKIPSMNKNLLSYKKNLVLSEAEKKQKFYSEVKNALEYNPIALDNLIEFLQKNIINSNTAEVISNQNSKVFLISLLYSLEDETLRDTFVNSIKHPDTYAQEIIPKITAREKYNKCGQWVRACIENIYKGADLPDYWMDANLIPGILEERQDFIKVEINDISELKPGAILTYQPGFWTSSDRQKYGHAEVFVWTNIFKNDDNTWVKYYAAHVFSSKYEHFYPYLWGSINQAKKEWGLNGYIFYHKGAFNTLYESTNKTKSEYAKIQKEKAYQETLLTYTIENTPVNEICEVKQKVDTITTAGINSRTNKYISAYLETNMDENNTEYVLRKLSTQWLSAKQCLESIAQHYQKIAKMEVASYGNTAQSQARLKKYLPKFQAVKKLLQESQNNDIAANITASPK